MHIIYKINQILSSSESIKYWLYYPIIGGAYCMLSLFPILFRFYKELLITIEFSFGLIRVLIYFKVERV
jgi:hypothetical protein